MLNDEAKEILRVMEIASRFSKDVAELRKNTNQILEILNNVMRKKHEVQALDNEQVLKD